MQYLRRDQRLQLDRGQRGGAAGTIRRRAPQGQEDGAAWPRTERGEVELDLNPHFPPSRRACVVLRRADPPGEDATALPGNGERLRRRGRPAEDDPQGIERVRNAG